MTLFAQRKHGATCLHLNTSAANTTAFVGFGNATIQVTIVKHKKSITAIYYLLKTSFFEFSVIKKHLFVNNVREFTWYTSYCIIFFSIFNIIHSAFASEAVY